MLAGILPICRFSQISHWTFTDMHLQKFPPGLQIFLNQPLTADLLISTCRIPPFSRFSQSATGHLLTCACRNSPKLQIFSNQTVDIYRHVLTEICPILQIFSNQPLDIYWHVLTEIPPGLQIFSNQLVDIYWHILAEICPILQIFSNQPLDIYWHVLKKFPQVCRFS